MGKYWAFYRVLDDNKNPIRHPTVYAFAYTKDDKKLFEAFRDMSMFRCEKFEDSQRIGLDFPSNYSRDRYRLKMTKFRTVNEFGLGSTIELQTTCEEEENTVLYYDKEYSGMVNKFIPPISIFNKKIAKNLVVLDYSNLYEFSRSSYMDAWDMSIEQTKTVVDEFAIFMKLYGKTINPI